MNVPADKSGKKTGSRYISAFIVLAIFFFVPAGTLKWPEAWLLLFVYAVRETMGVVHMRRNNPDLIIERLDAFKKPMRKWDRKIVRWHNIFFILMISVAGIDAVRYRWSSVPNGVKAPAFIGIILSSILIYRVYRENAYLSKIVEVMTDKGHAVVSTGPYRYIRHPLYLANICSDICIPFALGSLYAAIPAFIVIMLFFSRTYYEDKTLQAELEGYKEYAGRVRYKIVPLVW